MRLLVSSLSLALLLAGCGQEPQPTPVVEQPPPPEPLPFEAAGPQAAPDPARAGPYPVGVRTVVIEDPSRLKADGKPRRLVTEIWYPAVESARGAGETVYDMRPLLTDEQRGKLGSLEVPLLKTPALRDAAPRKDRGQFPVVIFSHGQGGVRWQSTYYTVPLASHGYVVISPDHDGNTIEDLLHDRLSPVEQGFDHRPADVRFLASWFTRLASTDPLSGLLDMSRLGLTGHSFGGFTTLRAGALDKRFKALVPLAPVSAELSWLGLPEPVELTAPILVQAGRLDRTLKWEEHITPTWARLKKPRYLLELATAGHFTFSDLCGFNLKQVTELIGIDAGNVVTDGCGDPAPPASVAVPVMNHFAIGFLNGVLRQSPGSLELLNQGKLDSFGKGLGTFQADP